MECQYNYVQKHIKLNSINDKINLFFFGDVHRDTESCDVERWNKFRKEARNTDNSYFVCMGDPNDFASSKEKKIINNSDLHDTSRVKFDKMAMKDIDDFCDEISFMKGRMLGFLEGNHSWIFMDGKKSDEILAERMDTQYLGWLCAYTLVLELQGRYCAIHMALCHGRAGGKRAGSSINQVEDMKLHIFAGMDIYVMAHDHNRGAWPTVTLLPVRGRFWTIKQKQQWLCRSGTFKKGYVPGTSGYEIGGLMRPSDIGVLQLQIGLDRTHKDSKDTVHANIKAII
jgi:hypothetical protein